jgi:hypothetical protein
LDEWHVLEHVFTVPVNVAAAQPALAAAHL